MPCTTAATHKHAHLILQGCQEDGSIGNSLGHHAGRVQAWRYGQQALLWQAVLHIHTRQCWGSFLNTPWQD